MITTMKGHYKEVEKLYPLKYQRTLPTFRGLYERTLIHVIIKGPLSLPLPGLKDSTSELILSKHYKIDTKRDYIFY